MEINVMNELEILINQYKTIDGKLDKISDKVEKLSTETIVQRMDIDHLKAEIVLLKDKQNTLYEELSAVKEAPLKEKAGKWSSVVNNIIKVVTGIVVAATLAYLGIKK